MTDASKWDKELAKIDRQLKLPDEALLKAAPPAASAPKRGSAASAPAAAAAAPTTTSAVGVYARVGLSTLLAVAMHFWPYAARCGSGLAIYLAAVAMVIGGGLWSSVWTWRHRASRAHILSLLLIVWGSVLGAAEVLPRLGYAIPTVEHPAVWTCQ